MSRLPAFILSFLFITLLHPPLPAAPSTNPADDDSPAQSITQIKTRAQRRLAFQWQDLPVIDPEPVASALAFTLQHEILRIQSTLPRSTAATRLRFTDLPGSATYHFAPLRQHQPEGEFMAFEYYDFSDPAIIDLHDQILCSPTTLQIVQDIEYPDRTQSASLTQSYVPGGVSLRVQTISNSNGVALLNLVFVAETLSDLRREHPVEVEQYLGPFFRGLGQQSIFAVDDKLAWQVVSDTWQPPADLPPRVTAILAQFKSENYPQRAAAQAALVKLGQPAALYLMTIDRAPLAAEQTARIDQFLHGYQPATPEQCKSLSGNPSFLLDCLANDDPLLRAAVLDHLQKVTGKPISLELSLPPAQRAAAIAKLRAKLTSPAATEPSTRP